MYGCIAHRLSRWQTTRSEGTPEMVVSMVALQIKCVISDAYVLYICTTPALDAKSFIARDAPSAAWRKGSAGGGLAAECPGPLWAYKIFETNILCDNRSNKSAAMPAISNGVWSRAEVGPRPTHTFILYLYCIRILYCARARPENIIPEVVSV